MSGPSRLAGHPRAARSVYQPSPLPTDGVKVAALDAAFPDLAFFVTVMSGRPAYGAQRVRGDGPLLVVAAAGVVHVSGKRDDLADDFGDVRVVPEQEHQAGEGQRQADGAGGILPVAPVVVPRKNRGGSPARAHCRRPAYPGPNTALAIASRPPSVSHREGCGSPFTPIAMVPQPAEVVTTGPSPSLGMNRTA
jgi:hypothetical protein